MPKLFFNYSTMNAGKSTLLLQASYNYNERGMQTYLLTANFDDRAGKGQIASRIGISAPADTYGASTDLFEMIETRLTAGPCACVLLDEAQWLTRDQVWQLARAVDGHDAGPGNDFAAGAPVCTFAVQLASVAASAAPGVAGDAPSTASSVAVAHSSDQLAVLAAAGAAGGAAAGSKAVAGHCAGTLAHC